MEREAFSRRLREALAGIGDDGSSPARVAREFNRRYPGTPISLHAARKWLLGEAIPAQDKLRVLADWLQVKTEWLRFGEMAETDIDNSATVYLARDSAPEIDYSLARDIASLPPELREAVRALVRALRTTLPN